MEPFLKRHLAFYAGVTLIGLDVKAGDHVLVVLSNNSFAGGLSTIPALSATETRQFVEPAIGQLLDAKRVLS